MVQWLVKSFVSPIFAFVPDATNRDVWTGGGRRMAGAFAGCLAVACRYQVTGCSRFSRLPDEGLQEGFARAQIAVANLCRGFAVALAFLLEAATVAELWTGRLEIPHRLAAEHLPQSGLVDIAQDGPAMVARSDIAHRVERVVGPRTAGRAKAETQMLELARVHQAGRYGHGATDPQAECCGKIIRLLQHPDELSGAGLQQAEIGESTATRIEAIEHDAVGPECQRQLGGLAEIRDVQGGRDKHHDHSLSRRFKRRHRVGHSIKNAVPAAECVMNLPPVAEQGEFPHLDLPAVLADHRIADERAIADEVDGDLPVMNEIDDLRQIAPHERFAPGERDEAGPHLADHSL